MASSSTSRWRNTYHSVCSDLTKFSDYSVETPKDSTSTDRWRTLVFTTPVVPGEIDATAEGYVPVRLAWGFHRSEVEEADAGSQLPSPNSFTQQSQSKKGGGGEEGKTKQGKGEGVESNDPSDVKSHVFLKWRGQICFLTTGTQIPYLSQFVFPSLSLREVPFVRGGTSSRWVHYPDSVQFPLCRISLCCFPFLL